MEVDSTYSTYYPALIAEQFVFVEILVKVPSKILFFRTFSCNEYNWQH